MDLETYRDKYNQDFDLNTEGRKCLCGSEKNYKLFKYDRYLLRNDIVVCKNCGLIYANPLLKNEFIQKFYKSDLYRKLYNLTFQSENKNIFLNEANNSSNSFNYLSKFFKKNKNFNILEIGSGHHSNLIYFKKIGNLFATDYSTESKKLAKKLGINFQQGGVEIIKKFNEKFDFIILSHVIEHFHDLNNDFLEIKKYTRNDTLFYIEVPSMDQKYNLDQLQNAHNFYFTKNSFLFHLDRLGLNCIEHGIASNIHQYGIFQNGKPKLNISIKEEYGKIIKIHKKFCFEFYWKYIFNFYLRKFIKKIVGKKLTIIIRKLLNYK